MSQPENQELANDNGEVSNDDAVMAALLAKGEPQASEEEEEQSEQAEESDEPAQPEQEAEEEDADPPQDEDLTFELDGKTVTLKKSQLPEVYRNQMLDADYRRKTAEVAEARRAAQEQAEQIRAERSNYANQLDVSLALMHKQLIGDQEALVELARTDPAEWVARNAEFQQRVNTYQQAVQQREQLSQAQRADEEREQQAWREGERKLLQEKLPEWKDQAVASAEQRLIAETLLNAGYSGEELSELFDHRALLIGRKAALWDQHQSQLQAAKAKQAKPEPRKTLTPGAPKPQTDTQRSTYQELLAKAKRTGKPDDVVRVLMQKGN
ncbi:TPA: hypothetical protein UL921_002356 [Stenotrophomonas maltophilia]|nr:hypothetical protein [Stenotrophomonas maltophilia]